MSKYTNRCDVCDGPRRDHGCPSCGDTLCESCCPAERRQLTDRRTPAEGGRRGRTVTEEVTYEEIIEAMDAAFADIVEYHDEGQERV